MSQEPENKIESSSANDVLQSKLTEMRDNKLIDFTNKKDYAEKLKVLAKDHDVDYTTAYKAMKKVAKQSGQSVGKPESKKKQSTQNGMKFEFNQKPTPKAQIDMAKKQHELKQKQSELESQIKMQEMVIQSPVFGMASEQNKLNLMMIREFIKGVGGKVGTEEQYDMLSKQITIKELQSGWQPSGMLANAMLGASIFGVFLMPLIPQIRSWLGKDDSDSKTEKSDEPLDEIPDPDSRNGDSKEVETKQ